MLRLGCAAMLLLWCALGCGAPAAAQSGMEPLAQTVCRLIEQAAHENDLPVGFMTRVIWRESSFRSAVVSPAGAEGIAQFMPGTAAERGLADPFDPEQAIPKAARLLAELKQQFGNLGFAAAAYNAGAARVASWLRGDGGLPGETQNYVLLVTDRSVEDWRGAGGSAAVTAPSQESCLTIASEQRRNIGDARDVRGLDGLAVPLPAPWGVQLAGNFSKQLALMTYVRAEQRYAPVIGDLHPMIIGRVLRSRGTRRFYQVRLPEPTRTGAVALCQRIRSVGGACVALHS